ncbi:hypothetical protein P7C71_g3413, partial [Lecanoromycetidae sp. Uapishka_2]
MAPPSEKPTPPSTNAKLLDLQQPEKLSKILKEDQYDCLSCRLTGAAAFIGLGGYIWFSGKRQLAERSDIIAKRGGVLGGLRARVAGTAILSSTFVGMGLYRLIN